MKRIGKYLMLISLSMLSFSCVDQNDPTSKNDTENQVAVNYQAVAPTYMKIIPVKDGYITRVTVDGEFYGDFDVATPIEVPKAQYNISRAGGEVDLEYILQSNYTKFEENKGPSYKVLMFEDSPVGDNDYNDVILHIKQIRAGDVGINLYIQPIAMGNTMNLKLGGDLYLIGLDGNGETALERKATFYFSQNIKKDFFGVDNPLTMINTYDITGVNTIAPINMFDGKHTLISATPEYKTINTDFLQKNIKGKTVLINWFIENDRGTKYYAVPSVNEDKVTWKQDNGYPYGVIFSSVRSNTFKDSKGTDCGLDWMYYPKESKNIETVFPGFKAWIEGTGTAPDWNNPEKDTFIDALRIGPDGVQSNGSMYDFN